MKSPALTTLAGGVRRVAEMLATPLVPSDYLDLFDPLRAGADLRGKVVSVEHETADAVTTTIRPGKGWRGHVPGQYIRIGVDIDGVRHWRAYSLTHDIHRGDGLISITTKAIPDGLVSGHLVRGGLVPGALVHLDQATGDFTLPATPPAKALFITAGSGITLQGNALRVFRELGVLDAILAHGYAFDEVGLRTPDGAVLAVIPDARTGGEDLPATVGMPRAVMAALLLDDTSSRANRAVERRQHSGARAK